MCKEEIFEILYQKGDAQAYKLFQQIENSIDESKELYEYFEDIKNMLLNEKSFVRIRAFKIICRLSKWDSENAINKNIDLLLDELDDDKPTAVRQALKYLEILLFYKPELSNIIHDKLARIDLLKYKDTMRPLIEKDIEYILKHS